jgi:hypothetical protein
MYGSPVGRQRVTGFPIRRRPLTSAHPGPGLTAAAGMQAQLYRHLLPWSGGRALYNFTASPDRHPLDARAAFDELDFAWLRDVKTVWDPANRFRFNVNVVPLP